MRIVIRALVALVVGCAVASSLMTSPALAADQPVVNQVPPSVAGSAQFDQTLTAVPGAWTPADVTLSYQWLRDGVPVGDDSPVNTTRRLSSLDDLGRTFAVRVTGSRPGAAPVSVVSAPTGPVALATFTATRRPTISGSGRYGTTLRGRPGTFSGAVDSVTYRWLRDGRPVSGATGRTYRVRSADVGAEMTFSATARRAGYATVVATSRPRVATHLRSVRKTVTYSVRTRGTVKASLSTFKRLAQQTYDDPRGWRAMGVRFKRVRSGGDFTLWLSQASKVPSFSSACSSTYSCRVGRNVVINETRWQRATPTWDAKRGTLRDYRHMVVNHETGHWFGRGHARCGGKGQLAPVMQQQSKGLAGCRINPWPKKSELHAPRYRF
ncbi:DUF3152 domain-containing protein [Aeromicrobium fastidiosum]|uniref:DUF3152 domain-containing protein n=1 Tax=Aeromicrobium fastidiosum TaxID=52699 RepID=A0A641AN84_9ACTN|nr:DUF3152 domain-containing protein [Aeromicrobium fastidiosum]MBP2392442.1 hypothetical protein [Aeromicrobium fastidiosum]